MNSGAKCWLAILTCLLIGNVAVAIIGDYPINLFNAFSAGALLIAILCIVLDY